jgi:glycosyltransferase involved in cell wall biosynthesis
MKKISIVTPSFNQGHYIEETITSVLNQNYPNLEYIIIDGGSTDNTVEIIKKYEKHLKYWVSEKDSGQANAINKGLKYCTGEIFNWLNSDDYLEQGALFKIAEAFDNDDVHMVAGKLRNFTTSTEEIIPNQFLTAEGLMCWKANVKFCQPSAYLKREMIKKCGGINETFHYAFDWDLYIRYLYFFPLVKEIPDLLAHFRLHENSKTQAFTERFILEERRIIENIYTTPSFTGLHSACKNKIEKTGWTFFLSQLSNTNNSFLQKLFTLFKNMFKYREVSFSRQTLGAVKAFLQNRKI